MKATISKWMFFGVLVGIAALTLVHNILPDHQISIGQDAAGCYWYKSWFDEVRCQNFWGAGALGGLFTTLQWFFIYGPMMFFVILLRPVMYGSVFETPVLFFASLFCFSVLAFSLYWPFTKMRELIRQPHR